MVRNSVLAVPDAELLLSMVVVGVAHWWRLLITVVSPNPPASVATPAAHKSPLTGSLSLPSSLVVVPESGHTAIISASGASSVPLSLSPFLSPLVMAGSPMGG